MSSLDLESRAGWPPDLRLFIGRYPRETWPKHANLGAMARLWLDIHGEFRRAGNSLAHATADLREGRVTHEQFRSCFAPRLEMFLSHLNGHHHIEDHQFFPLFGAAEPRLGRGFEVLEEDHRVIHTAMDKLVDAANTFLRTPPDDRDRFRKIGDGYADTSDRLMRLLVHHLDDEEDLIIPLILDRGEDDLGL